MAKRSLKPNYGATQSVLVQEKPTPNKPVEYHEVVCPECSYWEVISKDAHPVCSGKCNFTSIMLPNEAF